MSRSTISTFQLFEAFPTQEIAREYLESRIWPDGVTCPDCHTQTSITTRRGEIVKHLHACGARPAEEVRFPSDTGVRGKA